MKLIIDAKELRDTLKAVKPWVPVKPHHQITEHILITTDDLGTHITTYDIETFGNAVRFPFPAFQSREGGCVVRFRDLLDLTTKSEGEVTLEHDNISKLTVQYDHTTFTLKAKPPDEFPDVPSAWYKHFSGDGYPESAATTFSEFTRATKHVYVATAPNTANTFTSGILIDVQECDMDMVGTDGRRLHYADLAGSLQASEWKALIPAEIALKIARLKADSSSRFEFGIRHLDEADYFAWSVDCIEGFCSLMDTPFPDWKRVIPTDNTGLLEVQADALARCIDRLSPIAKAVDGRDMVTLAGNNVLTVSARAESKGSGESTIECDHISGPDMLVALNYSYLLDVLKLHKGKAIHLKFEGDLDPVMIRSCCDGTRSCILMPVRLPED